MKIWPTGGEERVFVENLEEPKIFIDFRVDLYYVGDIYRITYKKIRL